MLPETIPSYSLGPFMGLAINGTLCLCCLVLGLMYPQYRPLKSLCVFYGALVCFFLGFAAYGFQSSQAWILYWYRLMLQGLVWLPFTWMMFARDLRDARPGAFYYLCMAVGILVTVVLHLSDHPAVLGLPLTYHAHGGVWRPQSWLLRPLIYSFVLVTNLAFIYLSYFRWWRARPRPGFVAPMAWGLGVWLVMGAHDAALSVGYQVPVAWNLQWVGGLWFSMCQVLAVGLYFRDILQAQELMQADLTESRLRFQEVAEMSPTAIGECDTSLNLTYANRAALEMLGYSAQDLARGINLLDLAPAGNLAAGEGVVQRWRSSGSAGYEEIMVTRKDGSQINALVNFAPIVKDGQVVGGRAAALDITDRTRTAKALKSSEERYRNILDQMEDGYYEADLKGNFVFFNDSVARMLEYDREELLGMNYRQYMDAEQAERIYSEFNQVFRTGRPQKAFDWQIITKSGRLAYFQSSISLMLDGQGNPKGFRGVARDVTQIKLAERDRQASLEAQLASQAKSQFLAHMSHEIRTPINAILGMSELAAEDGLDPRTQARYLETITHEASALMSLVNDILDFTKIEAGKLKLERVELAPRDLVEGLAQSFAQLARRGGVDLYCLVDPDLPQRALGDPGRLNQMLTNLVMNSLKFTPQGEINIEVLRQAGPEGGLAARFTVQDTGIGISQDKLESIFESFTQADDSTTRRYGGSGLGLTIVKELAGLMGGELGVSSQEGRGSSFWFQVPLETMPGDGAAGQAPDLGAGRRVLLLHQSPQGGRVAQLYLEALGFQVALAASPAQALELAGQCQAAVLGLAGQPKPADWGADLPGRLGGASGLPVLVLAAPGQAGAGQDPAGPDQALIPQPLRLDDLAQGLESLLDRRPGQDRAALPSAPAHREPAGSGCAGLRVLLAEDYPTNRLLAQRHLTRAGCRVTAVEDGRQAVEAFARQPFDLVLLDVQMPEMDGYAASRAIRALEAQRGQAGQETPRAPIVALTAHATKEHRRECFAAGMDDYLAKPFRRGDLLALVRKWGGPGRPGPGPPAPEGPLDIAEALAEFDGDRAFLRQLLEGFEDQARARLEQMRQALSAGDAPGLANLAHAIKGGAANLTAKAAATAAQRLEASARSGGLAAGGELLAALEAELERLFTHARQNLKGD